jgi:hypothetical protein
MQSIVRRIAAVLGVVVAGALAGQPVGCSSRANSGATPSPSKNTTSDPTGTAGFHLMLPGGETLNTINWVISELNDSLFTTVQHGSVDVLHSASISFVVGGIPSGLYSIALSGTSTDGTVNCVGSARFSVGARTTTSVSVLLQCGTAGPDAGSASVGAHLYDCGTVTGVWVSPSETAVGTSVSLSAAATGPDPGGLTYAWSAPSGTFAPPDSAATSFTCTAAGVVPVTLTVSDGVVPDGGTCNTALATATVQVTCTTVGDPCLGPAGACSSCPDTDGDGLPDAWENALGIDYNGDGVIDSGDVPLPGAQVDKPDIYVQYDYMDYGLPNNPCTQASDCLALGAGHTGETCIGPGGTCAMACSADSDCTSRPPTGAHVGERCIAGLCEHTHDPLVLNANALQPVVDRFAAHGINLHLVRGHAQPHSQVVSFRLPSQMDNLCEGASLASGTVGLGKYAVSIYDIKHASFDPREAPFKHFLLFSHYNTCDTNDHCSTASPSGGTSDGGTGDCTSPTNPDGTTKNSAELGTIPGKVQASGFSEIDGNDLVVSLGPGINDFGDDQVVRETAGAVMHELGHNLGLDHGGPADRPCTGAMACPGGRSCLDTGDGQGHVCHEVTEGGIVARERNYKPNYLSVMNYRYQYSGIAFSGTVGSTTPIACTADSQCTADGGSTANGGICVSGSCVRMDYSLQTLPTLLENNLNEPAGLGSGTADMFTYKSGTCSAGWVTAPTTGPVDWDGDGTSTNTSAIADVDQTVGGTCDATPADTLRGFTDWPDLSGVPFQYAFYCRSPGAD